jgi:hypothetical protein
MKPQLSAYLRQIAKTLSNQDMFTKQEIIVRLTFLEHTIKDYLTYPEVGRLSFFTDACTCPTAPNLVKPNSAVTPNCPIHTKE